MYIVNISECHLFLVIEIMDHKIFKSPDKVFSSKPSILKVLIKHCLTMISKDLGVTGISPERKGLEEIILGEMLTKEIKNRETNGVKVEQNI